MLVARAAQTFAFTGSALSPLRLDVSADPALNLVQRLGCIWGGSATGRDDLERLSAPFSKLKA
jgi:hypothetical protein